VALDAVLAAHGVPLLHAYACGLIGYMRLVTPLHYVFEAHPDNPHADLRLDCPFPALQAMAAALDLDALPDDQHRHVPYSLVLLHYLARWRAVHGDLPAGPAQQKEFKAMVQAGKRRRPADATFEEENFDEALKNVRQAWYRTRVPPHVAAVLARPEVQRLAPASPPEHVVARAIADFVANEGEGRLPVRGTLPDMEAGSEIYTRLQQMYACDGVHHGMAWHGRRRCGPCNPRGRVPPAPPADTSRRRRRTTRRCARACTAC
jgi:amyloid beta precursor protein binding protein 1